jgi:Nuclease-related domain
MRVVELSNHPGAMLREIRLRPDGEDARDAARYEAALAQHREQVRLAEQARDAARSGHRWWAWLRGVLATRRARRHLPVPPRATGPSADQQEILMAGIAGEQLVASGLGRVLNDEWTLIRGYRNRRGEIDHLLLGPQGLIAIEGKHRNALVHCAGDHWWFTKFDKYGNVVERGEITDSRGRSPSQQVNEPASQLESFLRTRGHPVAIQRVVLLTHPRSRLGNCVRPTVHVATTTGEVIGMFEDSAAALSEPEREQVERLIIRDHRFHASKRKS